MKERTLVVRRLGLIEYGAALELQRDTERAVQSDNQPDTLLLLEHPHTITLGRNGRMENLLGSEQALRSAGISFHSTDRGGDITYHGPGQAVGYPIVDLRDWKRDVGAYVRADTPPAIVDKLAKTLREAANAPQVKEQYRKLGFQSRAKHQLY